jgi:putative NADH-flavin reductase
MKVVIFGATGGTGRELVAQALAQGHVVTAFARDPAKVRVKHENLRVVKGDMLDENAVAQAVAGQDAVLSALGVRLPAWKFAATIIVAPFILRLAKIRPPVSDYVWVAIVILAALFFFRKTTLLSTGTRHIVGAMERQGVRRFVCESSLGVGDSRGRLGILANAVAIPLMLRNVFADKEVQERIIRESGLEWVIVRPAILTNGPRTGRYRAGPGIGHWFFPSKISRADVADFMLQQLASDACLRQTPGIAY